MVEEKQCNPNKTPILKKKEERRERVEGRTRRDKQRERERPQFSITQSVHLLHLAGHISDRTVNLMVISCWITSSEEKQVFCQQTWIPQVLPPGRFSLSCPSGTVPGGILEMIDPRGLYDCNSPPLAGAGIFLLNTGISRGARTPCHAGSRLGGFPCWWPVNFYFEGLCCPYANVRNCFTTFQQSDLGMKPLKAV